MDKKPNIIFLFSDQQRADTLGVYGQELDISPNIDKLANEGVIFEEAFTAQPVCGPCRAIFQSGLYPTQINCYRNGQALPLNIKTLANYMEEAGYENAYVGKWHLASERDSYVDEAKVDYETSAIPVERRGGYKGFWRAADVLEATSHGYDGYIFDENMNKIDFKGYRVDKITDFALEFLDGYNKEKSFFLTISHIEPHHQNDRNTYEGPDGSKQKFKNYKLPFDLESLGHGNADEMYPDYLGCCKSIDDNMGRLIEKLKEKDLYNNTIIIYSSDHGSHFKTRNKEQAHLDDYKRTCHSSALKVPLIICGGKFTGGKKIEELVSTSSIPKTILAMAGVDIGNKMIGEDLEKLLDKPRDDEKVIYAQISESRLGRCIRTKDYLYSVYAPDKSPWNDAVSNVYEEEFLYDLNKDPYELNNLIDDKTTLEIRKSLSKLLVSKIKEAGEGEAIINIRK